MKKFFRMDRLNPQAMVLVPLALLSVIAAVLGWILVVNQNVLGPVSNLLLFGGLAAYVLTVFLLGYSGRLYVLHLEDLGLKDSLTGLPNRRALHRDAAQHGGLHAEHAIALIDLDGFKLVNDQHGHNLGDMVLKYCAELLRGLCADGVRCYRLGGDEFAIAMSGPHAGTIVEGIGRSLIDTLRKPLQIDERRVVIGASIGLAISRPPEQLSSAELLRRSDVAMYASKKSGKMRCTWFIADFDQQRAASQELDDEMRLALVNGGFYLEYQPLVHAHTGQVVAVESLLRWHRAQGEPMGPHIFIPIAEESGLINAIGLWVLRRACSDALAWADIILSVNISAAQLRDAEFPIHLGQILEETGFPPERLELEITETSLILDPLQAERTLDVIRGFGVNIALDDFGTGYASIGFLRRFHFEKLKLDRSLVIDAGKDEGSRAMMLSSISIARALKMAVTAEGVETPEQADMARAAGCDQIQGWLFFRAMPAEQIAQHLCKTPNGDAIALTGYIQDQQGMGR